ncbi:hypothetical protein O181_039753 [Austropuccinia psidii MF-1]|uniref:Integrase catalytic domain-containing protein n=1 Tax=Austropuccinia psidii MF-1 TaxID=1389203 RepID=A0A9Q3DFV8_9BASI|nr:hypothetical protein [Austropuccinia psidii MF-1]
MRSSRRLTQNMGTIMCHSKTERIQSTLAKPLPWTGFSKRFRCLPCHNKDKALDTALLFSNKIIATCGIPKIKITYREPKFTSEYWANLYHILGTKIAFSTDYHTKTDGLSERMIRKKEEIIRRFCEYVMEYKDHGRYAHNWVSVLPAVQLAYYISGHFTKGVPSSLVEKKWNSLFPADHLKEMF